MTIFIIIFIQMGKLKYIHGYDEHEQQRLLDQGDFLHEMVYENINFSDSQHVLEIGCGVGANMITVLSIYPDLKITGVDINVDQIEQARENLEKSGFSGRYQLIHGDASSLQLNADNLPDAALFCWVLEHVQNPIEILSNVRSNLQANSPVYLAEVFNRGMYIQPTLPNTLKYWEAYNILQSQSGDIVAGVKLGYHLKAAGFHEINMSQISQFHDLRDPVKREVMIDYLLKLLLSAKEALLKDALIDEATISTMKLEFEAMKEMDSAIIFYPCFQAFAKS